MVARWTLAKPSMLASARTPPGSCSFDGTSRFGCPCPRGWPLQSIWSFIIGYPLFRLRGHYFAIATIATSLVLKDLFSVWSFVGAARGLEISPIKYPPPDFLRLIFKDDTHYYYVILGFFFLAILFMNWFRKSRLGFQLRCIKDDGDCGPFSLGSTCIGPRLKPMPSPPPLSAWWAPSMSATSR